jgi:hypothetical protein
MHVALKRVCTTVGLAIIGLALLGSATYATTLAGANGQVIHAATGADRPWENQAPAVTAFARQVVNLGAYLTLSSCYSDPDGDDVRLVWSGCSQATGRSVGVLAAEPCVRWRANQAGTYLFTVRATDSSGASATDQVTVVVNRPPTVRLTGPRFAVAGAPVVLAATACDPDGDALAYGWAQTAGTGQTVPLCNATGATLQFTPPEAGSYTIGVFVRDGRGGATTTSFTVTADSPPTAWAGASQTVYASRPVNLWGCGYDDDGDPLTFVWTRLAGNPGTGPAVALTNRCGRLATFTPRDAGTYNFQLAVTDSCGASATSTVTITAVLRQNRPPQVAIEPAACALTGVWGQLAATAFDPDGDSLTYRWTCLAGPDRLSLRNSCGLSPQFSAAKPGSYEVELTASDRLGGSAAARVTVVVQAPPRVAVTGLREVEAGSALVLSGTVTGTDNAPLSYRWCRIGGSSGAVSLAGANTANLTFRTLLPGTYTLRLAVTDGRCGSGSATVSVRVVPRGVHAKASLGASSVSMLDVTTFTLENNAVQDTIESTAPAAEAGFAVLVTEGRTRRILAIDTRLTLVNSGSESVPLSAVAMILKYRSRECGWLVLGPAVLGDRAPLKDCTGLRHGTLKMLDAAGNPLPAGSMPVLAGKSSGTFRLTGEFDATCMGFEQNTPVTVAVWTSFAEDASKCTCRERGHRHGRHSVFAMERNVTVSSVVRLNERVHLTDVLASVPDASLATLGALTVRGVLSTGATVSGSISTGSSFQQTIAATGKAGSRSVFVVSGPVQFSGTRCGSTPAATTAALVGTGTGPAELVTLFGNPDTASISLISRNCPPDPGTGIVAGDFVTYTQGGWGSKAHGNNPGTVRDGGFPLAFPAGLLMGGQFQVVLSTAAAVEKFLPQGGTPSALTTSALDPKSTSAGVLGGQLAAVSLNVAFSAAGLLGQRDPMTLGQLAIASGPFAGMTVSAFLNLANRAVGGDATALPEGASLSQVNDAAASINECFDNGSITTGFLRRP